MKAPVMKTRVGRVQVPVRGLYPKLLGRAVHPTLLGFCAGARGEDEAGVYCFWTAILKRPYVNEHTTCTVRAHVLLPPGERFERMARERRTADDPEARRAYDFWWEKALRRGTGIAYIRPATQDEAERWIVNHPGDAVHLVSVQVGPPQRRPVPPPPAEEEPVQEKLCLASPLHLQGAVCCLKHGHAGDCQALVRAEDRAAVAYEAVHHPAHYNQGDIEHCELVEDQGHADGYYFGQVTKYLFRAGHKPTAASMEDLQKAHWYMARWVAWRTDGKKIWKIRKAAPDVVFKPSSTQEHVTG